MPVPYGTVPGFLPGAASLVEQLDKRLLVVLRDSRHLGKESTNCHYYYHYQYDTIPTHDSA